MQQEISNLKYTTTHEWISVEDNNHIILGITKYAVESLGDIVYVELPKLDSTITKDEQICVIESSKAAAEVYSPINGTIIAVNEELESNPEHINETPYNQGWIVKIKINDPAELEALLSFEQYQKVC